MGYYIDLKRITIGEFCERIKTKWLSPGRAILKKDADKIFEFFQLSGISNVSELKTAIEKSKSEAWSKSSLFSVDYLKIMLREINSFLPKPNLISDFTEITDEVKNTLEKQGIKNTFHLYEKVLTVEKRAEFANMTGIKFEQITELASLTDLSRIRWVGATFARVLYNVGVKSVEIARQSDFEEVYIKILDMNRENRYFKGKIGLNDIRVFIEAARIVPVEMEI